MTALIFVAKGEVLGQILTVVFSLAYAAVSLRFRYYGEMITFAYSLLGDVPLAEDCVQETFARLPRAAARLRNPGSGKAFVFAVARHAAMELLRKNPPAAEPPADLPDDAGDFTRTVEAAQILLRLDEPERQILVLHIYCGWTFRQIAALLDRPASTVKSCYARAKARVRQEWRNANDLV